jgi:hypothetical protein
MIRTRADQVLARQWEAASSGLGPVVGSRVVNEHDVFVGGGQPAPVISAVIEAALGAVFQPGPGPDPVPCLITGTTKVFFHGSHPFEDDRGFPVSRYACWINVHDSARNRERQLAVARRIFDAARVQNWPAMLSYGTQGHIAIHP